MSIITISRGTFSGGQMLAKQVAERLGYRCVGRETLLETAAWTYRVSEEKLAAEMDRAPSLLRQFFGARGSHLVYFRAALCDLACEGPMVFHGYVGHLHLTEVPHVLRVRVIADMDYRAAKAAEARGISTQEAVAFVKKADAERREWTHFLFGVEWDDPKLYDAVLNLSRMSMETACEVVVQMAKSSEFQPTAESNRALHDLALRTRVTAALLSDLRTRATDVDVTASDGVVALGGMVGSADQADTLVRVARGVEGVKEVINDLNSVSIERFAGPMM